MSETWDYSYVIILQGNDRKTLKVLHYRNFNRADECDREWYRIYPQDFDYKKTASEQPFGFGKTLDEAFKRYFATLDISRVRTA